MDIIVKGHDYFYELTSSSMLFFPGEKVNYVSDSKNDVFIRSYVNRKDNKIICTASVVYYGKKFVSQKKANDDSDIKDAVKHSFYIACSKATGITSLWGTLTGIRPLSVFQRLSADPDIAKKIIKRKYLLDDSKAEVLSIIDRVQKNSVKKNKKDVSVYVSIPFCPSKCTYCSFISISAVNKKDLLDNYLQFLKKEIESKLRIIKMYSLNVCSLYIGGGTPGILSAKQLEDLLSFLSYQIDLSAVCEKCFEIGRPDTVDADKLLILKNYGFDRICLNTQTTCDRILNNVNRAHSSSQYFDSVILADKFGFKSINTDLIAGLPDEDVTSFKNSVDDVIGTGVNNITVHTLSIKKSAKLAESNEYYSAMNNDVKEMIEYAYSKLIGSGYVPYYIYRQKNCVSNGENIGFCKPGHPCLYNIYMMEDIHTVIACGAGASSKIVDGKKVQRVINVKYPMDYVADFCKVENNTKTLNALLEETYKNE